MHACSRCGFEESHAGGVRFLDERDEAVASMRREARRIGGDIGDLLQLVAERVESEGEAVDHFERGLRESYERTFEVLRSVAQHATQNPGSVRSLAILNANVDGMAELLEASGIINVRLQLVADLRAFVDAANASAEVQGLPAGIVRFDAPAVRALIERADETFWQGKIVRPAATLIREGLDRALGLESLTQTVETIHRQIGGSISGAVNQARTQIEVFDRTVNTQVAIASGIRQWIYLGPLDGLTRPFCRALLGLAKVFAYEQMQELDNHQIPSPLVSGGGWSCRHRWVVVSGATVDRSGMSYATDTDVRAVNAAARGRGR